MCRDILIRYSPLPVAGLVICGLLYWFIRCSVRWRYRNWTTARITAISEHIMHHHGHKVYTTTLYVKYRPKTHVQEAYVSVSRRLKLNAGETIDIGWNEDDLKDIILLEYPPMPKYSTLLRLLCALFGVITLSVLFTAMFR